MTVEDTSPPRTAVDPVPETSETDMWIAELLFMLDCDIESRSAQFAIRTAVRAQGLAAQAGTNPVDELLEARLLATNEKSRQIYNAAIAYLRADQILTYDLARRR